ncbi:MAG: EAL domain-containing protein [Nostoc sp.]
MQSAKNMSDLSTLKIISKAPKLMALFAGGFSIILGFIVIVAWHIHLAAIIQLLPNSPAMRYNTALAFFLSGWALLALIKKWRRVAAGLSLLVALIGSLTLAQYIFQVDIGIDQFFIHDYLTNNLPTSSNTLRISEPVQQFLIKVNGPLPGRPSPNTALGFTLLGVASLCLSVVRKRSRLLIIAGLSSAGTIAIGLVSLLGYISGLGTAYEWGHLTGVAIPTALGLLILGVSFQLLAVERVDRLPRWFPLSIGFGVFTANLFLWQAISSWKNIVIKQLSNITDEVQSLLNPVAQLVLLEGLFLTLLVILVLYYAQLAQKQAAQLKLTNEELFYEKELAQITLNSIGDGVITTDATGKIEYLNPVAEMLTGWSLQEVKGLPLREVFRIFHEITREPTENPVEKALKSGQIVALANHTVLITHDDKEIAIDDSAAPIRDRYNQIVGAVMVFHDCTQNRSLSREITWQASHDSLTGLVNRHEFEQCLEQAVNSARTYNLEHALCYLDLDQFKIVNDTCGHAAGDELLRQVTTLLQTKIRQTDVLARLGGDEFGAVLYKCSLEQAIRVAEVMRKTIQEFRFVWEDNIFSIGASIGLVEINAKTESGVSLLSYADAACYAAKNKGRNRVHLFQSDDEELLQQRGEMQWVSRITKALEENRFCLYSQTIVAIAPTATPETHYEILLRLRDEEGNLVAPMAFIPAAERYNLMPTIDRWVINTLFKSWSLAEHNSNTSYAINLSGTTINDDQFISFLHEQFALYQVPPQLICFEITETVAITNLTKACQFITELQRYGCRFSLDDFGSGMSSFTYLKTLPVDYLKIDGGFVQNIIENSVDDAMVEAITRIGHVMGLKIIAEFVENDAILQRIKALGVDYAQGYGVAKPRPLILN